MATILMLFMSITSIVEILGHGRLMEPPNRSSLWRLKEFEEYDPPVNYDDDQLYCGAIGNMVRNGGKCGVCGDDFEMPSPRENENGGKYGLGITVRNYQVAQIIDIAIDITTSHWGYFEFRICPLGEDTSLPEGYNCFDKYLLQLDDNSGTRYNLTSDQPGWYNTTVRLPPELKCERCVLQWHYRAENTWNFCAEPESLGNALCGYQETFRGCSDISIGYPLKLKPSNPNVQLTSHKTTTVNYNNELNRTLQTKINISVTTSKRRGIPTMRPPPLMSLFLSRSRNRI